MAITSARMQMRRGLEADFDPDKMKPGEWAVSTDEKYVRMCFYPGVCVRMATYESFEADMSKIQAILSEVQTIEEAVIRINEEVSANADAVVEYTEQAKQYRDEAKQFRDEAEVSSTNAKSSEDKAKVSESNAKASETNAKISEENAQRVAESLPEDYTELSKAFYNTAIKQKAVGDNIHVTDSAEARNVEFGLYGKAKQKQYSGKNLVDGIDQTFSTDNKDEANIVDAVHLAVGTYTLSWVQSANLTSNTRNTPVYGTVDNYDATRKYLGTNANTRLESGRYSWTITINEENDYRFSYWMHSPSAKVTISDIQLESGPVMTDFEPYVGGIASPNPDYPQEITVAGSNGSVEVVSCGKNLLENTASTMDRLGITFTVNDDGSVTTSGTATDRSAITVKDKVYLKKVGAYKLSGCPNGGSETTYILLFGIKKADGTFIADIIDYGNGASFSITQEMIDSKVYGVALIYVFSGYTANNLTFKPMIRLASDTDATYEPYKESTTTVPTPNGLCGIKVSSGGNYTDKNGQQWICDEIVKYADGSGKRIQRIGKSVLSSEYGYILNVAGKGILLSNASTTIFPNIKNSSNYNVRMMSNVRQWLAGNAWAVGSFGVEGNTFWFEDIGNVLFPTIEDWTNYLDNNEVIMYYEFAEPIITDLTAEEIAEIEKLHTFYPITNISNDSDCGMAVTYIADSKNYIDGQLAIQKDQQEEALATMLLLMPEEVQASMIENDTNNLLNESEV